MSIKQHLRRPCNRCSQMFQPSGKYNRLCDECLEFSAKTRIYFLWIKRGIEILKFDKKEFEDFRYLELKKDLKKLNQRIKEILK